MNTVIEDIIAEIMRAQNKLPKCFDEGNTRNDWIAYINAYTGRSAQNVFRNEREGLDFRSNMIKAAGLAISAIAAFDEGHC
jgi:hypothetical protein